MFWIGKSSAFTTEEGECCVWIDGMRSVGVTTAVSREILAGNVCRIGLNVAILYRVGTRIDSIVETEGGVN